MSAPATRGDTKKVEATVGIGPSMLEGYRPNVGFTLVRHPGYFVPGLPSIDRIEVTIDADNASRLAAFLAGKYDLGWEARGPSTAPTGMRSKARSGATGRISTSTIPPRRGDFSPRSGTRAGSRR